MMSLPEIIKLAYQSVKANLLRSVLTLMIIAIGITALVGILTAIDSIIFSLKDNLSGLGANSYSIYPKGNSIQSNRRGVRQKQGDIINYDEAVSFKERFNEDSKVAISAEGLGTATVKYSDKETNPNVAVRGIDDNYLAVQSFSIEYGRDFSTTEQENGANRAIIGKDIVKTLFKDNAAEAINKSITVNNNKYQVIGVLKSKGSSMNQSSDRVVIVPLLNLKRIFVSDDQNYDITVGVYDATTMEESISQATGVFRTIRKVPLGNDNDFEIFKSDGIISIIKDNTQNLRVGTVVIGLMTLLGAAIGLMNIMLVSVTERTKEIGIAKALGATRRTILTQFLTEAILICQVGGIVGIVLGVLIGLGVAKAMGGTFHVPWLWMLLGLVVCFVVGIISGWYPAQKAAKLDPIESLRYE
jgi:putative ABC transport system permease protein